MDELKKVTYRMIVTTILFTIFIGIPIAFIIGMFAIHWVMGVISLIVVSKWWGLI